MAEYRAEWPIVDINKTVKELRQEADDDLADMLEATNLVVVGPVTLTLVAHMHVIPEISPTGDLRPWESRAAMA